MIKLATTVTKIKAFFLYKMELASNVNKSLSSCKFRVVANCGPVPASFLFILVLFTSHNSKKYIELSIDDVLGIRTRGPQDGRRRRIHRALAAVKVVDVVLR